MTNEHKWRWVATLGIALSAGCADPVAAPRTKQQLSVNGAGRMVVYNAGVDRAVPGTPCLGDERHRQFDFWVGTWQMGAQRSVVRSLLDGCMIEENYMPPVPPAAPGLPPGPSATSGRSINAYDRDTGKWHQTWISLFPRGHLRMSGNLQDGVMKMGAQFGPLVISYQWERVGVDQVLQSWNVNGRPGSLLYTPLAGVTLVPPAFAPFCQAGTPQPGGDINRQIDFFLGDWTVSAEAGPELGSARIESDMNGCLAREDYTTPKGYAAHSYIYYDLNSQLWHRTYIDSEAERSELSGKFINGALVLNGAEFGPDGKVFLVRNTIRRLDSNTVVQAWETSDDGTNWMLDLSLTFVRR